MLELLANVSLKLFVELLIATGIIALTIGALWVWNTISPKSFTKTLEKVARYFK